MKRHVKILKISSQWDLLLNKLHYSMTSSFFLAPGTAIKSFDEKCAFNAML